MLCNGAKVDGRVREHAGIAGYNYYLLRTEGWGRDAIVSGEWDVFGGG